jgi:adenylosuccinate lyase
LKELTRGQGGITRESLATFIDGLKIPKKVKEELKSVTPENYIGIIGKI